MSTLTTARTLSEDARQRPSFVQLWWQEWRRLASWYPARDRYLVLPAVLWLLLSNDWQTALCWPLFAGMGQMHAQMRKSLRKGQV